jgi:hypothetical protein
VVVCPLQHGRARVAAEASRRRWLRPVALRAFVNTRGPDVVRTLQKAAGRWGYPAPIGVGALEP